MSLNSREKCFVDGCIRDAVVVCSCKELLICQDHLDDHHSICDRKLHSVSKYQRLSEQRITDLPNLKVLKAKLRSEIIKRSEAFISLIHSECVNLLVNLSKFTMNLETSNDICGFDLDLEFFKIFEKLEDLIGSNIKKSELYKEKQETLNKKFAETLNLIEKLKSQRENLSLNQNSEMAQKTFLINSIDQKIQEQEKKLSHIKKMQEDFSSFKKFAKIPEGSNEEVQKIKDDLIKEQREVLKLKKSLEEKESELEKRRCDLFNYELSFNKRRIETENLLSELWWSSNLEVKKKIIYLTGIHDWRIRDALILIKTTDEKYLFNCNL